MAYCSQNVEMWRAQLKAAGWEEYSRGMSLWKAPWGALYRGPHKAWHIMRREPMCDDSKPQSITPRGI